MFEFLQKTKPVQLLAFHPFLTEPPAPVDVTRIHRETLAQGPGYSVDASTLLDDEKPVPLDRARLVLALVETLHPGLPSHWLASSVASAPPIPVLRPAESVAAVAAPPPGIADQLFSKISAVTSTVLGESVAVNVTPVTFDQDTWSKTELLLRALFQVFQSSSICRQCGLGSAALRWWLMITSLCVWMGVSGAGVGVGVRAMQVPPQLRPTPKIKLAENAEQSVCVSLSLSLSSLFRSVLHSLCQSVSVSLSLSVSLDVLELQ
jgi:hypothetical protein